MTKRLQWPLQGLPTNMPGQPVQLATTEPGDNERIASMLRIWLLTEQGERLLTWNDAPNAAPFGVPLRSKVAGTFEPLQAIKESLQQIVREPAFLSMIAQQVQVQVTSVQANGLEPTPAAGKNVRMTIELRLLNINPINLNVALPLKRLPIYLESEEPPNAN